MTTKTMNAIETVSANQAASAGTRDASRSRARRWALAAIVFAVFTDMLIYEMVVPLLPKYVAQWNVSPAAIGFLFSAFAAVVLLSNPLFGVVVDRWGRRGPLLGGALGLAASTALLAVAEHFGVLVLARLLQGISGAAIWTAGMALVADSYPREQRGRAMGTVMTGISLGPLIGPLLGGVLFERVGSRAPFYFGLSLAVLALALLWRVVPKSPPIDTSTSLTRPVGASRFWQVGILALWTRPAFRAVFVVVVLGGMMLCLLEPTLPLHLDQHLGAGPEAIGWLFVISTAAYGMISPVVGFASDRWGRRPIMAAGIVSAAVSLPLIAIPTTWPLLIAVTVWFGMSCAMLLTPALPEMADVADGGDSADYGSAYAWFNMAYALGMLIGTGAGGWLAAEHGLFVALCSASCIALICFVVLRVTRPSQAAKLSASDAV
jgi:MFS transporter, DHA1 family, solute carrier family 18 (vesicular amine transporter), member 1/2